MGNAVAENDLCYAHLITCAVFKPHQYQLLPEIGKQIACTTHCHSFYIPRRFYSIGITGNLLHSVYPEGLHFNYPSEGWLDVGCLSSFACFLNIALLLKAVQIPL